MSERTIHDLLPEIFEPSRPAVVIECGAYVGDDTELIWTAASKESSRYIAIEPDYRNATQFRIRHQDKPIQLIQAAVGDRCGLVRYRPSYPAPQSGSIKIPKEHLTEYPDIQFPKEMEVVVPMVTLDDVFAQFALPRVDFQWWDCQGAEDLLIEGGRNCLAWTRWLYTEFSDKELYSDQIGLDAIHLRLPGQWSVFQRWQNDVLFRNDSIQP